MRMSRVRRAPTLTVPTLNKNKLSHRQRHQHRQRRRFPTFIFTSHSLSLPSELSAIITTMATYRRSCKRCSKVCYILYVCVCLLCICVCRSITVARIVVVLLLSKWLCFVMWTMPCDTHTHSCTLFVTASLIFSNISFVFCFLWSVRLGMCLSISVLIIVLPLKTMRLALWMHLYTRLYTHLLCICLLCSLYICICQRYFKQTKSSSNVCKYIYGIGRESSVHISIESF